MSSFCDFCGKSSYRAKTLLHQHVLAGYKFYIQPKHPLTSQFRLDIVFCNVIHIPAKWRIIMSGKIIGRQPEKTELTRLYKSRDAEFLAIYGRRRVGKTYLIRNMFNNAHLYFEITGQNNSPLSEQLNNFADAFSNTFMNNTRLSRPQTWREAFNMLISQIENIKDPTKKVIFFDELPWLASRRSSFLPALDYFWNHWASQRTDILLIVCGSAASWMIKNIVHHKGGLHNRITARIRLLPFTLHETELYLQSRNIKLDRIQITELYMTMGGIPHYLRHIQKGVSASQSIDIICFGKDGILVDEFSQLFSSLFEHAAPYIAVIRILAKTHRGMTREDILQLANLSSGGSASDILSGLEESGFIGSYIPFGKIQKDTLYYLMDEYSLFYLTWIEKAPRNILTSPPSGYWLNKQQSRSWSSWSGYAFERICQKHSQQINKALGINGISTIISSWQYRPKTDGEQGVQIDLVIDRADRTITLCEIKFSNHSYLITKSYARSLQNKIETFRRITKTPKTIFLTMITPHGVEANDYAAQLIGKEVILGDLFV